MGATAHKQGLIAGENALGGHRWFAGSLGTQVVKVFDLVAACTGLRDHGARAAGRGWTPAATASRPGDTSISIRLTGDTASGLLLGAQLVGHRHAEISKRVNTYATGLFHGVSVDGVSEHRGCRSHLAAGRRPVHGDPSPADGRRQPMTAGIDGMLMGRRNGASGLMLLRELLFG